MRSSLKYLTMFLLHISPIVKQFQTQWLQKACFSQKPILYSFKVFTGQYFKFFCNKYYHQFYVAWEHFWKKCEIFQFLAREKKNLYNLASFLRDLNTVHERPRRTWSNSKNDESAISKCRFSQTRIMGEAQAEESKLVITNSVFSLACPYIYIWIICFANYSLTRT